MSGIDPKWVFILGIVVTIEQGISGGSIKLAHAIPETWIPAVDAWSSIFAFIGTAVMTALSGYSSAGKGLLMPSTPASPPAPPKTPIILLALGLGLFGWLLFAQNAMAQTPKPRPFTGDVRQDFQNAIGGVTSGSPPAAGGEIFGGGDKFAKILAKPFNDLADFINSDAAAAAQLAVAIPELQDGHGQQCWMAMGQFTAVLKAHPIPLTLHAATDLEAFRLAAMAANNLCRNPSCTQVFADLANGIQKAAPINIGIPLPDATRCASTLFSAALRGLGLEAPERALSPRRTFSRISRSTGRPCRNCS
jgi:hypothetical protein